MYEDLLSLKELAVLALSGYGAKHNDVPTIHSEKDDVTQMMM